ncbi:flagellar motor switch protein FliN/FliY [Evansella caseinilytica]|uniref:Flagellar motor switch protein FliN/FliY n=1 Tax=Evansella caseinilytica TaxID=1503961 RepID=A0A1H3M559_9BACI|nr:flagellar motor switch protein FliN/FliY [Evansella caseinilytica]
MSDMLSQDEINALLSGMNSDGGDGDKNENDEGKEMVVENYLSGIEQDALGEIGNISFGSAATALSTLLNQKVDITTPTVSIVKRDKLADEFPSPHVAISVEYTVGFEGLNLLVIKTKDAAIIADLMLGNDGTSANEDLGEMEISAVQEAMNQMMGSASTSMSTIFNKRVDISPPGIDILQLPDEPSKVPIPEDDVLAKISFRLKIGDLIDSKIMQLVTISFAKEMVSQLMNPDTEEEMESVPAAASSEAVSAGAGGDRMEEQGTAQAPMVEQEPVQRQAQPERSAPQHFSPRPNERAANVQPAAFSNFDTPSLSENEAKNLDMLMDIPLEVTVELGRTKRSIKDILEFTHGSIIELDKLAGEPVDILVNQRLIAKGEVVVIDENFGVRVTDILSPKERIYKLK